MATELARQMFRIITLTLPLILLGGCVVEKRTEVKPGVTSATNSTTGNEPLARPVERQPAPTTTIHLLPLGTIPFNQATLPLVSPDGMFIASETGLAPAIETINASFRAIVPTATRVEVFAIAPPPLPSDSSSMIAKIGELEAPMLLGRSANNLGFIVEQPQQNGSRWIGFVEWKTGELTWIAQDTYVNAYAALGRSDSADLVAWVRRRPDDAHFELVIRRGEVIETSLPPLDPAALEDASVPLQTVEYLFPTWSDGGDGLFVFELHDDATLNGVFLNGSNMGEMMLAPQRITISKRGTRGMCFQMLAASPAMQGVPVPNRAQLIFFHPEYLAMAVWRPHLASASRTKLLEKDSIAAAIDANGFALYAVDNELAGRPVDGRGQRVHITNEMYIPRLTDSKHWPFLLFSPIGSDPRMIVVGLAGVAVTPVQ
ncbi:MAG: hypothetical protein ACR2GY_10225 [Phycisphaerales bacterium]